MPDLLKETFRFLGKAKSAVTHSRVGMKCLLIGAGNIGSVIARDLLLSGCDSLTVADVSGRRLEALRSEHKGRVETLELDVTDEKALASQMREVDVTVNATSYRFDLHVLRAAIDSKCDAVDLGGLYHTTLQELQYDRRAKEAGICIVLGMGDDPGTSNVLARMASWELDSVSEIRIRWGSIAPGSEGVGFGFSIATCLDEATMNAVKFADGEVVEIPPLSEEEEVSFPEPVGLQRTYAILHSELATLPKFIKGVRNVTYKDSWDRATIDVVNFLRSSGLASSEEIVVEGSKVSPRKVLLTLLSPNEPKSAVGCLVVKASGRRGGKHTQVTHHLGPIRYSDMYHAPCTAYSTAIPASIMAQMMSNGLIEQKGVLPPEVLTRAQVDYFLRKMKSKGLVVRNTEGAT
jgi:saccharopine dehydrogenase-like NADP-dependent oxidoreductase